MTYKNYFLFIIRSGKEERLYPWGNKWMPKDEYYANTWTGTFPTENDVSRNLIIFATTFNLLMECLLIFTFSLNGHHHYLMINIHNKVENR